MEQRRQHWRYRIGFHAEPLAAKPTDANGKARRDTVNQANTTDAYPATAARWTRSANRRVLVGMLKPLSPSGLIFPTTTEENAMKTAYAVKWHYSDETPKQATETIVWALDVADAQQRFETDNRIEMVVSVQPT